MLADEEPGLAGCLDRGLLDSGNGGVEFLHGGCGYSDEAGVAQDAVPSGEVGFLLEHVVVLGGPEPVKPDETAGLSGALYEGLS